MIGVARARFGGQLVIAAILIAAAALLTFATQAPAAGVRKTYIAERPGVTVRITATPGQVLAISLKSAQRSAAISTRFLPGP